MIKEVQNTCELDAEDSAHAIKVVLETLGECLPATERKHIADQLPVEFKHSIGKREYVSDFDLEQFYIRVASRERIRYSSRGTVALHHGTFRTGIISGRNKRY